MNIYKKLLFVFLILLTVQIFPQDKLVFGVHPCFKAGEVKERFIPLVDYISKSIGIPITLKVGENFDDHMGGLGKGIIDIAYSGPNPYIDYVNRYDNKNIIAMLETSGTPYLKGNIITGLNSGINEIEDLIKCNMAFVNKLSTMGYIVPMYYIYKNTSKKKSIKSYKFLNNHNDVCLGILSGDFDAGAVKYEAFLKYKNKGLRSIVAFDSIPGITIIARKGLDKKIIKAIRKALINIKSDKDSEKILKSLNPLLTGFVSAKDSDFDKLRKINKYLKEKGIID